MPKKQKSVKKTTARVKASAKSIVNINIGKGKSSSKRPAKKAEVVQNVIRTSPTIYNPAPTPFQISAPQPKPFSSAAEIAQELRRLEKTSIETAIQPRVDLSIAEPITAEAIVAEASAEETKAKQQRIGSRMKAVSRAQSLGLSTEGTTAQINERIGAFTREGEIVGIAKGMLKQGKEITKKDPFV